ncbi:acetoacetate--CoA ligase [Marinospirillum sp.]|uniref:acetoacetate--CoA ligase n=1 Tax=Marinospirillum sp. TaxID=2183934 RepID=UPI003A87D505
MTIPLPLWQPATPLHTPMGQWMQQLNQQGDLALKDYADLHQWSLTQPEAFWSQIWSLGQVIASQQGDQVLVPAPAGAPFSQARWFPEARLNFAENLLRFRDQRPAIIACREDGQRIELSYAELYQQVAQLAASLRDLGIQPGDRVAGYLPNSHFALIAMLATTSLGGIWSSCSPDFGVQGVLDRFGQIQPRLLFATDGYLYQGKRIETTQQVAQIAAGLPELEQLVLLPYLDQAPQLPAQSSTPNYQLRAWSALLAHPATEIDFAQLPFDHPLYILFSSGTTGVPKCIVHSAGGTLLQHLKELILHTGLTREDVFFYYTTCGWMMWNWQVSALALGTRLVLFDGSPFAPEPRSLWDLAEREQISVFGTSAKYLSACEKAGLRPKQTHQLPALRTLLSTGSPLSPESFAYVYREIKDDLLLASISGGTDIVSCFALGCPLRPVYAGQLQCRGLGMAVEVWNEAGQAVVGEKGELVCTQPFPSMPLGFWQDEDGKKYQAAYFERFPGVWAQGDYAELTAEDGLIIYGRSDAVLNPGGVRIGTAEIYRQVETFTEVAEALCIGQQWQDDVRVVLFVRLQQGQQLTPELEQRLRQQIRQQATPRHVPAKIVQVADIPRTRSGKIVELAVREVVHGRPVKNQEALANPEALALFAGLAALQEA